MSRSTKASKAINKIKKQAKGAWDKSREKEAVVKGAKLPGGIIGGVAKFLDFKIDETEENAVPYITLTFLILEPDEHNGKKERKTYYFQDSPDFDKTIDDGMEDFSSALQLLGIETRGLSEEDWDKALKQAKKDDTFIEFNTRQGKISEGDNAGQLWYTFDLQRHLPDYTISEDSETTYTESDDNDDNDDDDDDDDKKTDDAPWVPQVDEEYYYRKKKGKKLKKCTVKSVDTEDETVGIILKNGTEIADVSWDNLEGESDE